MGPTQPEGATMSDDNRTARPAPHLPADALPDPEPAVPSLSEPDPGVFHHDISADAPRGPEEETTTR